MKNVKRCWNHLNLYDYRGVEEHLNAMAAKGWRLEKAGPQLWTYRRAEPARVHYAVTYIQDSSQFNPGPTERQLTLEELCAAAGWEKVCDCYQMQIFVSKAAEPVPLETDEALRLEVVHRSMKKNFIPGNVVLLLFSLLMGGLWVKTVLTDPLRIFGSNSYLFTGPLWLLAAAVEIFSLGNYWLWYRRSSRAVAEGGCCAEAGRVSHGVNRFAMTCSVLWCTAYLLAELACGDVRYLGFLAVYCGLFAVLGLLVRRTTAVLRRRGASWGKNLAGTLAVDIVLAFIMVFGLTWTAIHFDWFGLHRGETYLYDRMEWDVSPIEIPLKTADLTGKEYEHIRRWESARTSLFFSEHSYHERVLDEGKHVGISYEIREIRSSWLYGKALEEYTKEEIARPWDVEWKAADPAFWGAEAVYQRHLDRDATNTYLICYPGQLVELRLDDTPTEPQMGIVRDRLAG